MDSMIWKVFSTTVNFVIQCDSVGNVRKSSELPASCLLKSGRGMMVGGTFASGLGYSWVYLYKCSHPFGILLLVCQLKFFQPHAHKGLCIFRQWQAGECHPFRSGGTPGLELEQGRQQPLAPAQGLNQQHPDQAMATLSPQSARSAHSRAMPFTDRQHIYWATEETHGNLIMLHIYMCLHTANPCFSVS